MFKQERPSMWRYTWEIISENEKNGTEYTNYSTALQSEAKRETERFLGEKVKLKSYHRCK